MPFALWCAFREIDSYEEALWLTVAGLGDRDTTCAIVGGILAARHGDGAIPEAWRRSIEAFGEAFGWQRIMEPDGPQTQGE